MYKYILLTLFIFNVSYASVRYEGTVNQKFISLDKYTCMYLKMTYEQELADYEPIKMGFVVRKFPSDTAPIIAASSVLATGADLTTETKNGYVSIVTIPWPVTREPYVKGWMKRSLMMTYEERNKEMHFINDRSYCKVVMVFGKPSDDHGASYLDFKFYYPEKQ